MKIHNIVQLVRICHFLLLRKYSILMAFVYFALHAEVLWLHAYAFLSHL